MKKKKYLFLDDRSLELGTSWNFPDELGLKRGKKVDEEGMIYPGVLGPLARVKRVMHQPERHGDFPLIGADRPWEGTLPYFGGRFLNRVPGTNKLRMYYQCWTLELNPEIAASSDPSNPTAAVPGVNTIEHAKFCMAESEDGLNWEKPSLGAIEWEGSTDNNIVLDEPYCGCIWGGVMADPDEEDERKRWKAFTFGSPGSWHGACVYFSPDGIRWTPYERNPVLTARLDAGDSYMLYGWDPRIRKYVTYIRPPDWYNHYPDTPYHRVTEGNWPFDASMKNHPYRTIGRSTSDDFIQWTIPEEVLAPDLEDPIGTQFYGFTVSEYEGYYVGHVWNYQTDSEDDGMTIDLATSADGIKWNRFRDGKPFFEAGDEGPWESKMIMATTSPFLIMGDEVWMYYAAFNCTHYGTEFPKRKSGIGLCKLRLDGFIGISSEGEEGYFMSRPIDLDGDDCKLEINADASRGYLKVGLIDENHRPVSGYSDAECVPLEKDEIHHIVRWRENENLSALGIRRVYFMFRLKDAEIFSYTVGA